MTADSRVLVDVSRCRLDRLPNLVILYEWVSIHRAGWNGAEQLTYVCYRQSNYTDPRESSCKVRSARALALVCSTVDVDLCCADTCAGMKKNPLANVPVWKQRDALTTLWRQIAFFTRFERDSTLFWNPQRTRSLRVVYPGECFLRESGRVLRGLCYDDQVQRHSLEVKCFPGMMCPERIIEDECAEPGEDQPPRVRQKKRKDVVKRKKDTRKAFRVEEKALTYEVPPEDLLFSAPHGNAIYERWRR